MKHNRVKTGQGLLWSLLGILLYVLAHGIPEWSAPYAVPGRLELSLTLAGLALLLAGAVRSYRASGAGAFAVGGVCAAGALLLQCLQWGLYWHILLPPPLLPIVLGAAGALFFCSAAGYLAAATASVLRIRCAPRLARIQWLIPILAALYLLSILLEIVWILSTPPNGSHDVVFGTSSALLVPVIHLANWLAQAIQSQALSRFALVPLCLAAVICLAPAWQYLRRIRETDPDKLEEIRKRLQ